MAAGAGEKVDINQHSVERLLSRTRCTITSLKYPSWVVILLFHRNYKQHEMFPYKERYGHTFFSLTTNKNEMLMME